MIFIKALETARAALANLVLERSPIFPKKWAKKE